MADGAKSGADAKAPVIKSREMLDAPVKYLKGGFGPERVAALGRLGVETYRDLLTLYPRDYEDRTRVTDIAELSDGENAVVRAVIASPPTLSRIPGGRTMVKVNAADDTGTLAITYFNQPFRRDSLREGEKYVIFGKAQRQGRYKPQMINPETTRDAEGEYRGELLPVYPLSAPLTQRLVREAVKQALALAEEYAEPLPEPVRRKFELCDARFAIETIHAPSSVDSLAIARRRLVFTELFVLSAGLASLRKGREHSAGTKFAFADTSGFTSALPFELTGAQKRAIEDVVRDTGSGSAMSRLVQGDVGSGKTMVAAAAAYLAAKNGAQSAIMAPTEILAEQHYRTLAPLFESLGIRAELLTGSSPAAEKARIKSGLADGSVDVVCGTSAVIQKGVECRNLALVVCDEQHRFGVRQREALTRLGASPHTLVMSATPIPRTLALAIYGDLDVSVIDELPPGRTKVDTFAVDESYRKRIEAFVRKQVGAGGQAFIVCPLVEEGDDEGLKSVLAYAETLGRDVYPDLRVAYLHGKMRSSEKERVMGAFAAGDADVLVSTTVIEVGVDVPNASLMVVENAERFGLSQLHQLRGRVGRGARQSYCIFVNQGGDAARERLKVLCATNDGFKIAEADLELRGPGDFFGKRQHGLPELKLASFTGDMRVLKEAQSAAAELLAADPLLEQPEHASLKSAIAKMLSTADS